MDTQATSSNCLKTAQELQALEQQGQLGQGLMRIAEPQADTTTSQARSNYFKFDHLED